jgi:hypothetical protein
MGGPGRVCMPGCWPTGINGGWLNCGCSLTPGKRWPGCCGGMPWLKLVGGPVGGMPWLKLVGGPVGGMPWLKLVGGPVGGMPGRICGGRELGGNWLNCPGGGWG